MPLTREEKLQRKREYNNRYRITHREAVIANGKKSYLKNWASIQARRKARKLAALEAEALRPKPDICDVCGGNDLRIEFDHCHQRGMFRGWLCHPCNVALGMVNDDVNRLRKLIAYLERSKDWIDPQLSLPGL